jgi:hypothetical protein
MPGHVWYLASAIIYFDSPGHSDRREDEAKLTAALQEALNKLLKEKTFTAASEHRIDSIEVTKVGATLPGVARAIDEVRKGRSSR